MLPLWIYTEIYVLNHSISQPFRNLGYLEKNREGNFPEQDSFCVVLVVIDAMTL